MATLIPLSELQKATQAFDELQQKYQKLTESLSSWIMFVLEPRDPASPTGIYLPKQIDESWIKFIKQYHNWQDVVQFERVQDELTGEETVLLWRKRDWLEEQSKRDVAKEPLRRATQEVFKMRYRVYRSTLRACRIGMNRRVAYEMIRALVSNDDNLATQTLLIQFGWNEPIDEELFEEFCDDWSARGKHVYTEDADIEGNV